MNLATMTDRRNQHRYEVCLDASWEGTRNNARVTDIAEGGCYVDSVADVYVGQLLTIKVLLPNDEWLELAGEVAHHSIRLGFGLKFVSLDNLQTHTLRWLIASLREPTRSVPAKLTLVA
jgi:hypothetical protein